MEEIEEYKETLFENIKHIDKKGNEYWYARELQKELEYKQWRRFNETVERAIKSCNNSNINAFDHFANIGKIVKAGATTKKVDDYKLSRYACYLIAQNGDSRKKVIALAQTYFAIQTRKQELFELEYNNLTEDEKRLYRRNQARKGNYSLNQTAVKSGVKDLARFHNAGYKGLYNGETADNIFRIAQTDAKLKRDNVDNEYTANSVHYEIGKIVRKAIKEAGGTMPEDLSTPDRSLKELEKDIKKLKE